MTETQHENKTQEWWRGAVFYQIYPRSFQDSNDDGIGDLRGIISRLDYLRDLGVDALWVSPFFTSPMKDFGYDVSDYCNIDPIFGTLADFDDLIAAAHARNLKIVIDQVWSHSSDQHPWFVESRSNRDNPKADWYVWADPKPDGTPPNNWLSYFGGAAWAWDTRRMQYYLHHFLTEQPALNLYHPDVKAAIFEIAAFWLERGVDGFRLDAVHTYLCHPELLDNPARPVNAPPPTDVPWSNPMSRQMRVHSNAVPEILPLIEEIRAFCDQWPDRVLLAEVGGEDSEALASQYVQGGNRFHLAYTFGLLTPHFDASVVNRVVGHVESLIEDGWLCWSTGNHDNARVVSRWRSGQGGNDDFASMAMAFGLALRGTFCIYQGEELGLPEADIPFEMLQDPFGKAFWPDYKGRDGCRTPMPWEQESANAGFTNAASWLPIPTEHTVLAANGQVNRSDSTWRTTRNLIAWRKAHPAMETGAISLYPFGNSPLIAWYRHADAETIFCIFNPTDTIQNILLPALIPQNYLDMGIQHGARVDGASLELSAYGFLWVPVSQA